jgi:hypothetical protein
MDFSGRQLACVVDPSHRVKFIDQSIGWFNIIQRGKATTN